MATECLLPAVACVGAACAASASWLSSTVRARVFSVIADRETGECRRKLAPPSVEISKEYLPGDVLNEIAMSKQLNNERSFITLKSGENMFYQTWAPLEGEVKALEAPGDQLWLVR